MNFDADNNELNIIDYSSLNSWNLREKVIADYISLESMKTKRK